MPSVLVVGAGVIGLTTALVLRENLGPEYTIKVVSTELPGDVSGPDGKGLAVLYASPRAGAHWSSAGGEKMPDPRIARWELTSYDVFRKMSKVPQTWVHPVTLYEGRIPARDGTVQAFQIPWYRDAVDGYEYLGQDDKRFPGVRNLYKYESYVITTQLYLAYEVNKLVERGVQVTRGTVTSLEAVAQKYDHVINCTGYRARNLVTDSGLQERERLHCVRGHTMLVANTLPYQVLFEEEDPVEPGEFLMLFPHREGGAVLGGIYDDHSPFLDQSVHTDYVERIKAKARKHLPELGEPKILNHSIGFRPMRDGGARVERDSANPKILHNYGCGNAGYIQSWGCAKDVLDMVKKQGSGWKL